MLGLIESYLENPNFPSFKKAYLKALLEKKAEFEAVRQMDLAEVLNEKIRVWVNRQTKSISRTVLREENAKKNTVSRAYFEKELKWARLRLDTYQNKIPRIEREKFNQRLNALERRLDHLIYDDLNELVDIRIDLQERLHQSVRALKVQKSSLFKRKAAQEGSLDAVVSHYNDSATLKKLFSQISESDPIWVADFLKLYGEMLGLKQHLTPLTKF